MAVAAVERSPVEIEVCAALTVSQVEVIGRTG